MADAREGKFNTLIVDDLTRLSRGNPQELIAEIIHPLQKAGVNVRSVSTGLLETFCLSETFGRLSPEKSARILAVTDRRA